MKRGGLRMSNVIKSENVGSKITTSTLEKKSRRALLLLLEKSVESQQGQCLDLSDQVCRHLAAFYGIERILLADCNRKSPWRMSAPRKRRQRKRLRDVDAVMATLAEGMKQTNQSCRALENALATWRNEPEMPAKDKYWVFSRKDRDSGYRKGAHKVPKWTKYGNHPINR